MNAALQISPDIWEGSMELGRMIIHRRLKPESVGEYVRYHQAVPPGLMELYRKAGVLQLSCFLDDADLVVFIEYDAQRWAAAQDELRNNPVEQSWQALMRTLNDPGFEPRFLEEVFHLPRA
jgi:L-rhamnose mutarotase